MKIVDAHYHLWDLKLNNYPWLNEAKNSQNETALANNYLVDDFNKDIGNLDVTKGVHIQAELDHKIDPVVETKWLQSIADNTSSNQMPNAIIAYANFSFNDIRKTLLEHQEYANFRGIRQILNYSDEDPSLNVYVDVDRNLMRDNKWQDGFSVLDEMNLSFDLQIWPSQMHDASQLMSDFKEVQFILNHTGCPLQNGNSKDHKTWMNGMKQLSRHENIAVKISGLFMRSSDKYNETQSIIEETLNLFGVNRSFFASNFPVDSLKIGYAELWNYFDEITAKYAISEKEKLFYKNAEKFYKI
jgi:predicted TIM-barrel fold metal-dependent hydrolase